ncbi:Phosphoglycerate mutase [Cordyceps fumosorosea ARSEF 2679]|uniref:Phosphoglycerate mutase n=1 Tax=Cordyceps fumosorosea (strain ARSEF 2679) TaxID=1081104 RepID=A0A167R1Q7_CORFA|nr:Phosphoglycerate mutase [Cordyceps fumosorosea ARSEF 2679]OAA58187.1 Phosphoglycerate mutase [Cordyceps fumosorosea ARSEF 2679]
MAKPRLIILIRHAQSEGNKNRDIHQAVPDHRVKLTADGWNQAYDAGRRLRALLRPDDKVQFFTSPYRRTRDTTEGILTTLTSDDVDSGPSPFRRAAIKVYEEPRLREQDFGNFQPCSAEMERMWQERADYGHFFYRIPNGESAADAYDRVSGFNESLWRQFGEDDFASVCVLVTHGLMSRVFLMKWYHFTVEYFEDLRNIDHCEFLVMRRQDNGKYNLETKLRTWSELKRERAALKEKEREKERGKVGGTAAAADGTPAKDEVKLQRNKTFVVTRRWGGCPDGCNHTSKYLKRQDLESLRQNDIEQAAQSSRKAANNGSNGHHHHRHRPRPAISSDDEDDDHGATPSSSTTASPDRKKQQPPPVHVSRATTTTAAEEADDDGTTVAPSEQQPTLKSPPFVHLGRDFGGSYSGHASVADSDSDKPDDEAGGLHRRRRRGSILNSVEARLLQSTINSHHHHHHHHTRQLSTGSSVASPGIGPFANRLGDAPPLSDSESGDGGVAEKKNKQDKQKEEEEVVVVVMRGGKEDAEDGDLEAAEQADRSIQGSVY